ncbi:GNAT family N-acetyltransferase [Streptomyces cavernicola]|uniref:GNAT family N-acetyltransferase n=1 Tax=Streptomyces cavernicola TaxID=3043613 RepID=A0ABT6S4S1_9ACTN|nr:GNAT family N-acetyltransferase [Streptomyces sp. B-S-A6]MDI3403099.1 GNAT family N-acetyltransferase [Streptomyces sp. B-S-A6]
MILRPLRDTADDLHAARQVATEAFAALGAALGDPPEPPPTPAEVDRIDALNRHFVRHDPEGCWIAEAERGGGGGQALGVAVASRREAVWGLSLLVVAPGAQGTGVGRALLQRALEYGQSCPRGVISGSRDPRAARAYWGAGFALHPAMRLQGAVDPARLDAPDGPVTEGGDPEFLDAVDRKVRGGAHGPDHAQLLRDCRLLTVDAPGHQGYCFIDMSPSSASEAEPESGAVELMGLCATTETAAARLLTAALRDVPAGRKVKIPNVTAEQRWAVDVALTARLQPVPGGYLCLRGMAPPVGFVPSGQYL